MGVYQTQDGAQSVSQGGGRVCEDKSWGRRATSHSATGWASTSHSLTLLPYKMGTTKTYLGEGSYEGYTETGTAASIEPSAWHIRRSQQGAL